MFPEKVHRYIFLFGICGLAFGMMIGAVPTSVPQFILLGNWLVEGDFKRKWNHLKNNKIFWALAALLIIHVIGLSYSEDFSEGYKDGRTKVPLLILPVIFFTTNPLSRKEFFAVLYCFLFGCIMNTAWCLMYTFVLHPGNALRDASRFMSHIRLGLYLNVAIACCVYFGIKSVKQVQRFAWFVLSLYFIFILYVLGLASGLANFVILFVLAMCFFIYKQRTLIKISGLLVVAGFLALAINYLLTVRSEQLSVKETENNIPAERAASGRPYIHFEKNGQKENGNYIQINVQPEELLRAWKTDFPADSFNYAPAYNTQRFVVLVRYMASKGLNKDSVGYAQLTAEDKRNIKEDIANFAYPSWSYLHKRTYELVNEYDEFRNRRFVNGHSLTMRLYFWKAAMHLIKQQAVFGVGTGDVQQALTKAYEETNSPLDREWYKRPHNQFLTVTVALGIVGLIVLLISVFYPALVLKNNLPKLYWPFLFIAVLSFFLEDTLETQAGCTFYAFFNTLFISVAWWRRTSEGDKI